MGLYQRIDRAAIGLYIIGVFSAVYVYFGFSSMRGTALVSGLVEVASRLAASNPQQWLLAALPWIVTALYFVLTWLVHRRSWLAIIAALVVVATDAIAALVLGPRYGLAFEAALQVGWHGLVICLLIDALFARRQADVNAAIIHRLDAAYAFEKAAREATIPDGQPASADGGRSR